LLTCASINCYNIFETYNLMCDVYKYTMQKKLIFVNYQVYQTIYLIYKIKKTSILRNKEIKTRYWFTRFIIRAILKKENIIRYKILKCFLRSILIASSFNALQIICK